jgi:oligosaccharide reducing-end xylanase
MLKPAILLLLAALLPALDGSPARRGEYPNLLLEIGRSEAEIEARLAATWTHFFAGRDDQRIYYEVEDGLGYILDVHFDDVRTEGLSYGMMIALQYDRRDVFDRLWHFACRHMRFNDGPRQGYFLWHVRRDGTPVDAKRNSAPDGELWFAAALFMAANRWREPAYRAEADAILHAMLHQEDDGTAEEVTNMIDRRTNLVVFVPRGESATFTDPSYQVPHFLTLFAAWAKADREVWAAAALAARAHLKAACHPRTGLAPDYAEFNGRPRARKNRGSEHFQYDAWRVAMNVAVDWAWFRADPWAVEQSDRLQGFFAAQPQGSTFTIDGVRRGGEGRATGLVMMNAVASLAASDPRRLDFVRQAWERKPPSGGSRYYNGCLYMLGLLQISGRFRVWWPD